MIKNRFYSANFGVAAEAAIAQSYDTSNTSAPQATYKAFVATAANGSIAAYWDDTNAVVAAGATALAANAKRRFFYAWKQADGTVMRTAPIPAAPVYKTVTYNAGVADVWIITFGGTVSVGQWLHVRIMDTTSKTIPYPNYEYQTKVKTNLADALTDLAAQINAEAKANGPVATATATSTTLVITANDVNITIKPIAYCEVGPVSTNNVDNTAISAVHTTPGVTPIGTYADVKAFENVYLVKNGAILYAGDQGMNVNVSDFQAQASNVVTGINYGYLVVTAIRTERPQSAVHGFSHKAYVVIAAPAAAITALAAL